MQLNVARKVAELDLSTSDFLLPLFEAVVNAVEAIEESDIKKGQITIKVKRDDSQQELSIGEGKPVYSPIDSFQIEDSGVGFNRTNFDAFDDAYTNHKTDKGGKGVGRFTILRAFKEMKVHSRFAENGTLYERNFTFDLKHEVVENKKPKQLNKGMTGSVVELSEYLPEYYKQTTVSSQYIAEKIVEHCLVLFISKRMPKVYLVDDQRIDLTRIFNKFMPTREAIEPIQLKDEEFKAYFIHKYAAQGAHKICFCSNAREVENIQIRSHIPNLSHQLEDGKGRYYLLVYIISKYLDKNVYEVRNTFRFPKKTKDKDAFDKLSLEEIIDIICEKVQKRYSEILDGIEIEKLSDIEKFVMEEGGIEYRHLLKNSENFKEIPPKQSKEKLDEELHRINYELERKHKKDVGKLLAKKTVEDYDEYEKELREIVKREHQFSISKLANYVVRRKVIIRVFDKLLEFDSKSQKHKYEEDLHNVVFPMGGDSDTVPFANHNLWLLDERLTFHTYVASDKKIGSMEGIESESGKEPDIAIFDKRFAFSSDDQFQSILVFEFKRPGRILSGTDRDVDKQVVEYFADLMSSKSQSYRGKLLNLGKETPKFGYIICEIDNDLGEHLLNYCGFNITSSKTYYKYMDKINLYIEVMTYQTMLNNVEMRHRAFFKQLGIDYV